MSNAIYHENDNVVELLGLTNEQTGVVINDAVVTLTLLAEDGSEIAGQVWPLVMPYVMGSDGDYRATLAHDLTLTLKQRVIAKVVADGGAGLRGQWEKPLKVIKRTN